MLNQFVINRAAGLHCTIYLLACSIMYMCSSEIGRRPELDLNVEMIITYLIFKTENVETLLQSDKCPLKSNVNVSLFCIYKA